MVAFAHWFPPEACASYAWDILWCSSVLCMAGCSLCPSHLCTRYLVQDQQKGVRIRRVEPTAPSAEQLKPSDILLRWAPQLLPDILASDTLYADQYPLTRSVHLVVENQAKVVASSQDPSRLEDQVHCAKVPLVPLVCPPS